VNCDDRRERLRLDSPGGARGRRRLRPLPGCSRAVGTKEGRPARWLAPPHLVTPADSYA